MRIWKGYPYPLGAMWTREGVNFALFSSHATAVELCLFDQAQGVEESHRIALTEREDEVWHAFLPDVKPGQLYGYRVHGEWNPAQGARFNPFKLMLDPYAKAIAGDLRWSPALYSYEIGHGAADLKLHAQNNAGQAPKSVVVDDAFDWGGDVPPAHALEDTIIYEAHVKGFTKLWEAIPPELRGTYAGLAHPAAIAYFQSLGITTLELLPVHEHADEPLVAARGLSNYWGYNTLGYFAPQHSYSSRREPGGAVREFKEMVQGLHAADIEVILDVVYNHTAEGNHLGPALSFRGIDNRVYYRLDRENPRYYQDYTGTGNTLNVPHARVLQLIMDSLRYWVTEMHVDGFRFDLAPALAREHHAVGKLSAFFNVIHQDPVVSRVKLIAEPWDVGEGGYHVGNFPVLWCEWNGRYRDTIRKFWRGDDSTIQEMACRLAGSPDLYASSGKKPTASINYVTCHDGFTLYDLVAYNDKHNEANGENNRDGENRNHSWNNGVEGETDDPKIRALRRRMRRNLMVTLLLSQGVPMIYAGDEYGRTQQGNNNAYNQDNTLNWLRWTRTLEESEFQEFVSRLIKLRTEHPVFHRPKFFQEKNILDSQLDDIAWLHTDGTRLEAEEWATASRSHAGLLLNGHAMGLTDFHGTPLRDNLFYLILNANKEELAFVLPPNAANQWRLILDTTCETGFPTAPPLHAAGTHLPVPAHSVLLLEEKAL
jgi:isoamylase